MSKQDTISNRIRPEASRYETQYVPPIDVPSSTPVYLLSKCHYINKHGIFCNTYVRTQKINLDVFTIFSLLVCTVVYIGYGWVTLLFWISSTTSNHKQEARSKGKDSETSLVYFILLNCTSTIHLHTIPTSNNRNNEASLSSTSLPFINQCHGIWSKQQWKIRQNKLQLANGRIRCSCYRK